MFEVEVIPGRVKIGSIDLLIDHPDVKLFHMDMETKYARLVLEGSVLSDDPTVERLSIDLDVDDSRAIVDYGGDAYLRMTSIVINVPDGEHWYAIAEASPYTVFIALFRAAGHDGTEVWRADR